MEKVLKVYGYMEIGEMVWGIRVERG